MRVIGHIPRNLGYQPMLEERQNVIAHAEEFLNGYLLFNRRCCDDRLGSEINFISKAIADNRIWVIPTLTIFKGIVPQIENLDAFLKRDEMKYIPSSVTTDWRPAMNRYRDRKKEEIQMFNSLYTLQTYLVKGLRDAGVRMMAGTDALATAAALPGFTIHEELQNLVAAGLTPYEALRTATYNPAEFLGLLDEFGTVSVGKRADLILLESNPLNDVKQTTRRSGVMMRGRWLSETECHKILQSLSASHN